jgi:hypothetical protein
LSAAGHIESNQSRTVTTNVVMYCKCPMLVFAPNRIKLGHKGNINTRNKFLKEIFLKSEDSPFDFG